MHADEKKGKQNVKITVDHQMQSEQGQWEGISKKKRKVLLNLKMIAVKGIMRDYEYGKVVIIIRPLKCCCHKDETSSV